MYDYVLLFICCWFKAWLGNKSVKLHCITFPSRKEIRLYRFATCTTFIWPSPELVCVCKWTHWTPCKTMLNQASLLLTSVIWWFGISSSRKIIGVNRYIGLEKSLCKQGVFLRNSPSLYFQVFLSLSLFFTQKQVTF